MILKNAKIYSEGLIREGAILIHNGIIKSISFESQNKELQELIEKNRDGKEIDCQYKLILPGIIDIHSHLRDMEQIEKETFLTGTKAAAFSGITSVFTMPNTIPPVITSKQVQLWMEKAKSDIYVDVGFIAGVPKEINDREIEKIINLGVIGFKIYPLKSLNEIDWTKDSNIQKILNFSSKYKIPIFIHPDRSIDNKKWVEIYEDWVLKKYNILELHDRLNPPQTELNYIRLFIDNLLKNINVNKRKSESYPIIHFCHISCRESFDLINHTLNQNKNLKISYEITPHHILLSKTVDLSNQNYGKVLPPLRNKSHSKYLFNKFREGSIELIASDHAPHTLEEKNRDYLRIPSGFPGFETYPLVMLEKVTQFELSLEYFVKAASENPALKFNLKKKGFIKEGYDADLLIIEKIPVTKINPQTFKTKAKYTPFENFTTTVQIWKVFLRGEEINSDNSIPNGKILKRLV